MNRLLNRLTRSFLWSTRLKRLLVIQFILLSIVNLFSAPTYDEWGHLPSGIIHLQFSDYRPYKVNPPLVRTVAAVPVWLLGGGFDGRNPVSSFETRSEWPLAREFFRQNGLWVFVYFWVGREILVVFALWGTCLVYSIAQRHLGGFPARIASTLWVFSPLVLAFGALVVPDIPATVVGLWATDRFTRWLKISSFRNLSWAAVATGGAMLTKSTWIILPVIFLLLTLIDRCCRARRRPWKQEVSQLLAGTLLIWFVVQAGYEFQGMLRPLGQFEFHSETLTDKHSEHAVSLSSRNAFSYHSTGNRFDDSWLRWVPSPLPAAYLEGIDVQMVDFDAGFDSYLMGIRQKGGWWYYYLVGLFLKQSIFIWVMVPLSVLAAVQWTRKKRTDGRPYWLLLLSVPGCCVLVLVSAQTGFNHHLRYVFPFLPIFYLFVSIAGKGTLKRWAAVLTAC